MRAYKVELLIIDHAGLGSLEIKDVLENISYPNHCINPEVMGIVSRDIGEWSDDHPLNTLDCAEAYAGLFRQRPNADHGN